MGNYIKGTFTTSYSYIRFTYIGFVFSQCFQFSVNFQCRFIGRITILAIGPACRWLSARHAAGYRPAGYRSGMPLAIGPLAIGWLWPTGVPHLETGGPPVEMRRSGGLAIAMPARPRNTRTRTAQALDPQPSIALPNPLRARSPNLLSSPLHGPPNLIPSWTGSARSSSFLSSAALITTRLENVCRDEGGRGSGRGGKRAHAPCAG